MNLNNFDELQGRSGTANAIAYTVFGKNTTGSLPLDQPLAQDYLAITKKLIYRAPRDITITEIYLVNTTQSAVSGVILYIESIPVTGSFTIPANGTFTYFNGVWTTDTVNNYIIGVNTNQITVSPTAPVNPQVGDLWVSTI